MSPRGRATAEEVAVMHRVRVVSDALDLPLRVVHATTLTVELRELERLADRLEAERAK